MDIMYTEATGLTRGHYAALKKEFKPRILIFIILMRYKYKLRSVYLFP